MQKGFTLLEILIAVAIFSLVSTATFSMLQLTIKTGKAFEGKADYLVELQRTHRLLQQDFSQVVTRGVRDEFGDMLPAVMTDDASWGTAIELTRTGRANPFKKTRSDLVRLRYFFDGDNVIRRTWKVLDRAPGVEFLDQIVLQDVKTWQVKLLSNQKWFASWPIKQELPALDSVLPHAFEITVSLSNEREFRWLLPAFLHVEP